MCDVDRFSKMYREMKELEPEDTLQLLIESKDEEEKEFFRLIGDYFLQKKQKKVIEESSSACK